MAKILGFLTIISFSFFTIFTLQSKETLKCLPGAVDIVFVVEDSNYVGEANFKKILNAIGMFSKSLDIGPRVRQSHLGFVSFGSTGNTVFEVNEFLSKTAVQKALSETKFTGGTESNMAYGIHFAIAQALNKTLSAESERKETPKIIYLIATGRDSSDILTESILAMEKNITIFTLGLGTEANLDHLEKANGDPKRVSQIDSVELIDSQLEKFCTTVEESFAPRPTVNVPRYCPCTLENLWLDIVFVVDASNAVGNNDISTVKQFIHPLLKSITISQQKGPYSRVAFVTLNGKAKRHSDLATYKNNEEALAGLESLKLLGGNDVNIRIGLTEAQNIISEAKKGNERTRKSVVIYMGPVGYGEGCKKREKSSNKERIDISREPCEISNQIKSSGTVLITIALRLPGQDYPYMDFGSDCFQLRNDENMMEHFISGLCRANCYCTTPYTQFKQDDNCAEYGECISKMDLPVGYYGARIGCQLGHASLANVFSVEKEKFLYGIAAKGESVPLWLGVKRNLNMSYVWDVDAAKEIDGDYSNWKDGPPADSEGDCAVLEKSEGGGGTYWRSEQCAWDEPAYFYFCQKNTCDTDNYCGS